MTTVLCASSLGQQQGREVVGEWAPVLSWPLQTIHGIVLKNGKVLCVADPIVDDDAKVRIWDPSTNTISVVADPPIDPDAVIPQPVSLFCSGHTQLADGHVVFFGGGPGYDEAHDHTVIFDPDAPLSDPWTLADDMPPDALDAEGRPLGRRWYPTATALSTTELLCTSGGHNFSSTPADVPLLLNATNAAGSQYESLTGAEQHLNWYPFMFELSTGEMFMGGSHYYFATADPNDPEASLPVPSLSLSIPQQQWTNVDDSTIKGGSAVMYRPDKIMKAGGGREGAQGPSCGDDDEEPRDMMKRAMIIDFGGNPDWQDIAAMNYRRLHFYLVMLPDGTVFATGGTQHTNSGNCDDPVLSPEIYDPDDPQAGWQVMAGMAEPRMYHSIALLLPDARVLVAGGQQGGAQRTAQVFSPPYHFGPLAPFVYAR